MSVPNTQLQLPFLMVLAGPTSSGKTVFLTELLKNTRAKFDKQLDRIVYYYSEYLTDTIQTLKGMFGDKIQFVKGLNIDIETFNPQKNNLVIIDDLIQGAVSSQGVSELFTRGSHHRNLSVILVSQNLFCQGKHSVTINRNSQYLVLFKNPRDAAQISCLAKQVFPGNNKFLLDAYKSATESAYGYLLLDFKQTTPDELRLRTNILPKEWPEIIFVPKRESKMLSFCVL